MYFNPAGPADPTPLELMAAVAERRDRKAFTQLFWLYAPKIKSYLRRGGIEDTVAEELAQEVMLAVWQNAARFDPTRASPSAWIYAIARNRRIDQQRRSGRAADLATLAFDTNDSAPATDGVVEARQRHSFLETALATLPDEQAEVLRLAFFEDKSHSSIASERSLPLGTVKSRVRLALRHLRTAMELHG